MMISFDNNGEAIDPLNLMVNYIPTPVRDIELRQIFSEFGEVESARVIRDRHTNHPKGYGFVKFKRPEDAARARDALDGFEVLNKRLKVTAAKPMEHRVPPSRGMVPQQQQQSIPPPPPFMPFAGPYILPTQHHSLPMPMLVPMHTSAQSHVGIESAIASQSASDISQLQGGLSAGGGATPAFFVTHTPRWISIPADAVQQNGGYSL